MIIVRILYRLYLVGAALGFWGAADPGAAPAGWQPCGGDGRCGVALVQGRRSGQEDRAIVLAGRLPPPAAAASTGSGPAGAAGGATDALFA
ncbi:hypothetical protein MNEG_14023, partial [Monoraphidium neglectum]